MYGLFIGATYLTPIVGGLLADRGLGYRRAVLIGAGTLAIGYFLLAGSGWLFPSLGVLVLGNGLFKPSITTMVGNLYASGDERRDRGFSIFYMGVNCGALAAPFCAEGLRASRGWSAAFAAAGGAMLFSILVLIICWQRLARSENPQQGGPRSALQRRSIGSLTEVEVNRIHALLVLAAVVLFFWLAFQQNGCTLMFWARNNTDRTIHWHWLRWFLGRREIPTVWFSAVNSLFVVVLSPLMVRLWGVLRRRGAEPSTSTKILYGMVLTAVAYIVMTIAARLGGDTGRVSMAWLGGSYLFISIAELCLSPMGLSMVTKLAPRSLVAGMMGVWFLATFVGNTLAGVVGMLWPRWSHERFFLLLVATSLASAMLLWLQRPRIEAAMRSQRGSVGVNAEIHAP